MTEQISLQPRHQAIIDFLTNNSPKRYSAKEIANSLNHTASTTGNEMLTIMRLCPKVQRSVRGRVYKYYVGDPEKDLPEKLKDYGKATTLSDIGAIWQACTKADYVPSVVKSTWKLPQAMALITKAALSDNVSTLSQARKALEDLSELATAYAVTLSRVLSTDELWADPAWLVQGMPEENLEIVAETTRQTLGRLAKLDPSKTETETNTKETELR